MKGKSRTIDYTKCKIQYTDLQWPVFIFVVIVDAIDMLNVCSVHEMGGPKVRGIELLRDPFLNKVEYLTEVRHRKVGLADNSYFAENNNNRPHYLKLYKVCNSYIL